MTLPGDRFASLADFAAWGGAHATTLRDRALAERVPPAEGTCVPCLRAARFAAGRCDCPDRLDAAGRALLHAALTEAGLCGWSRLLRPDGGVVAERLVALAGRVVDSDTPEAADVAVLAPLGSPPGAALTAVRRALGPAGCLIAAMDFDPAAPRGRPGGPLGWDVLETARSAGFAEAAVLRPWSRELGYAGGLFLLRAVV